MAILPLVSRLWSRFTGQLLGFGIGAASAQAFEPIFADLSALTWSKMPNRRLTPEQAAMLVLQGRRGLGDAAHEASETGIDRGRFEDIVALVGSPPGLGELIELWRRGALEEEEVRRALRQARTKPEYIDALLALRRALLAPPTLAGLVARGLLPLAAGQEGAARQGVNEADFARLVEAAQSAPPVEQVLELVNRGELDEGEARAALRRAGLEERYLEPVLALREVLPSPADLVRFAVREVYTPAVASRFGLAQDFPPEFAAQAARLGLSEETARQYWAAHWDLPSPEQGFRMLHRGIIGPADLDLLLRALDVMPFWRPKLRELTFNVPGRIDIRRMFRAGVLTEADVLKRYGDLGYAPADAAILTQFAVTEKMQAERDLSKAEIVSMYQERSLSRAEAEGHLATLGYDAGELALVLGLADVRRNRSFRTAATGVVRSRYVARELSDAEAAARLDRLGLPAEERDQLMDLWTFQREETPRRLSEPQARAALRRQLISESEYLVRLEQLGYPDEEAGILLALSTPAAGAA